jgi:PPM family protein phosphatase
MLRVAEQYAATDTGRQRRANEDSLLARSPLFVVADGMGGAQAGEVASRIAVESFHDGLGDVASPEDSLAMYARAANSRIHELSQSNVEQAGMGTTLTAVYVGEQEVAIAHVGDSRAYCLRDGELLRLTDDHSLVDELIREGRLTPEEAEEHPQRSIITRALGPEETVEVDTRSFRARPDDLFLLCSDGLTSMVPEARLAELLRTNPKLRAAGEALIAAANAAGGRDNITVILLRLEEVELGDPRSTGVAETSPPTSRHTALAAAPTVVARRPRRSAPQSPARADARGRVRKLLPALLALIVLGLLLSGAYLAAQSVYFIGTDSQGLVTMFQGFPYELPGPIKLYSTYYVTGVSASTLSPARRRTLLDHSLYTEAKAGSLLHSLELGELSE